MKTLNDSFTSFTVLIAVVGSLFLGCANENSPEQINREKLQRVRDRYKESVTNYQGFLIRRSGTSPSAHGRVPFSLDVSMTENPTTSDASLLAKINVGLFGGVNLTTTSVRYDQGTGELNAILDQGSTPQSFSDKSTVRIQVFIKQNVVTRGSLYGANSRWFDLDPNPQFVDTEAAPEASLKVVFTSAILPRRSLAILDLTPSLVNQPSKSGMDLPQLPPLSAALRFEGLLQAPMQFKQVLYDPLKGEMELDTPTNGKLVLRDVFLPQDPHVTRLTHANGTLYQGASSVASAEAKVIGNDEPPLGAAPPYYAGTLMNSAGVKANVIATLVYGGSVLTNAGDAIFQLFPGFQLQLLVCAPGTYAAQMSLTLREADQINGRYVFGGSSKTHNYLLEATIPSNWSNIEGRITSGVSSSSTALPLSLRAVKTPPTCR